MPGLIGLRGQSLAGPPLLAGQGLSRGLIRPPGLVGPKLIDFTRSGPSLNTSTTSSTITTPTVTFTPKAQRRGEIYRGSWRQLSGFLGVALSPYDLATAFRHIGVSLGSHAIAWRFQGFNQFGDNAVIDVAYTITREDDPPETLTVSVSPTFLSGFRYDGPPGHGAAWTGSSTASVSGGSGNYQYTWSGGISGGNPGVSISGQGTASASFGADIPDQSLYNGSFSVSVVDLQTGATGGAGGSLQFASAGGP